MTKLLYCMRCKSGFQLEIEENRTCKCGNVGGTYTDRVYAGLCAQNPDLVYFAGINKSRNDFENHKKEFLEIKNDKIWEEWQKGHVAQCWEK